MQTVLIDSVVKLSARSFNEKPLVKCGSILFLSGIARDKGGWEDAGGGR